MMGRTVQWGKLSSSQSVCYFNATKPLVAILYGMMVPRLYVLGEVATTTSAATVVRIGPVAGGEDGRAAEGEAVGRKVGLGDDDRCVG